MNGQIGYTDDGMVFMTIASQIEGKPTQTLVRLDPDQASRLSEELRKAAIQAKEVKERKIQ